MVIVCIIIRDLNHKTWMEYTPGEINRFAVGVEAFREEVGNYPQALSDLKNMPSLADREYLSQILERKFGTQFQYRTASNGFFISATKTARLFSKQEEMELFFQLGKTPGGER